MSGTSGPATPHDQWSTLSAALTGCVGDVAEREDVIVRCAPGLGAGAPGCFTPALATIELDGNNLDVAPETCVPARPSDRERYPALWGVLVHEAGHARHTRWNPPVKWDVPDAAVQAAWAAAMLLEEARMEAAQLRRRPGDRHWLRAASRALILGQIRPRRLTRWCAAQVAGLLLARVDAGILDEDEVVEVSRRVEKALGARRVRRLRAVWKKAQAVADDDGDAMLALGRRWCRILRVTEDRPPSPRLRRLASDSDLDDLVEEIQKGLAGVAASEVVAPTSNQARAEARAAENELRQQAKERARQVFGGGSSSGSRESGRGRLRPPSPAEQAAARRLARALRSAAYRERVATTISSPTPPGRLRMHEVLRSDAQRAAGAMITAEPFVRTTRRVVPSPPLRLGIACDVSGSMKTVAGPVASAAWILARAAGHLSDASSAAVVFADHVHPLTYPGAATLQVRELPVDGGSTGFSDAVDALDDALGLSQPGGARLLAVVSDGQYPVQHRRAGQMRVTRLLKAGCGVLWLNPNTSSTPLEGAQVVTLGDPSEAIQALAQAAVRALGSA